MQPVGIKRESIGRSVTLNAEWRDAHSFVVYEILGCDGSTHTDPSCSTMQHSALGTNRDGCFPGDTATKLFYVGFACQPCWEMLVDHVSQGSHLCSEAACESAPDDPGDWKPT